jgi:hypothetical protein
MAIKLIRVRDPSRAVPMYAVGRRAFANDILQMAVFPSRLFDPADPDERHRFRIAALKKRLATAGIWSIAAVDEDITDEDGDMKVLGYAAWYEPQTPAAADNQPQQDEEGRRWVDCGEGGWRGDGVKYPRCMDMKVQQQLDNSLAESKLEVLGEPARPAWCMFTPFFVDTHGAETWG